MTEPAQPTNPAQIDASRVLRFILPIGIVACLLVSALVIYPKVEASRQAILNCPPGQLVSTGQSSGHWILNTKRTRCATEPVATQGE